MAGQTEKVTLALGELAEDGPIRLRVTGRSMAPLLAAVIAAIAAIHANPASGQFLFPPVTAHFDAAEAVEKACGKIGNKLGSVGVQECRNRSLTASGAFSVEGTAILTREFPPKAGREPLGRVLIFGGIHGDEYASVSVMFKWLRILERNHSGLFHWRASPLVNPDGLLRRKSRRTNSNGVDLNRNFPTPNWEEESRDYWVRRTSRDPRRYPGPWPVSEPETQWLVDEINRFEPDVIVSVHAPYRLLDFDGPPKPPNRLGSLKLRLMGTYPGSLGRYAGVHRDTPVVTIELAHAGIMPSDREIRNIWIDLIRWLRHRLSEEPGTQTAGGR